MPGGYERVCYFLLEIANYLLTAQVNARDEDDHISGPLRPEPIPSSPPPSFHSRSSSPRRNQDGDQTLFDAFDDDNDASDDETDDRQRLVRQAPGHDASRTQEPAQPAWTPPQPAGAAAGRPVGGGVASDGVFANMSARPERQDSEKDEQPPVCAPHNARRDHG